MVLGRNNNIMKIVIEEGSEPKEWVVMTSLPLLCLKNRIRIIIKENYVG